MDPLAETTFSFVPYSYCLNNPVLYYDSFGLSTYKVGDQTYTIDDGDPNFRMDVSQKQYDKLSRKFERNVLGYARYRNRLSKKNGFTNTEVRPSDGSENTLNASAIIYHQPERESYIDYQANNGERIISNVLSSLTTDKKVIDRIGIGSNSKVYFMHANGRIFNGNQYVSVVNLGNRYGKIAKGVSIASPFVQVATSYSIGGQLDPVSNKLYLSAASAGAAVSFFASKGLTAAFIAGGAYLGPAGAVVGGYLGGIAGSCIGELANRVVLGDIF